MGRRTDDIVVPNSQGLPQVIFATLVLEFGKGQDLVLGTFRLWAPSVLDGRRRWRRRKRAGVWVHDGQDRSWCRCVVNVVFWKFVYHQIYQERYDN
jgi:hypothetical protein